MIISIEGVRGAGKSHLLQRFTESNANPNVRYYKFYLSNWVPKLGFASDDSSSAVHYISLGNILTVLESMHSKPGEFVIFDRSLFSAYVWAILRKRLSAQTAIAELRAVMQSPEYHDFVNVYVESSKLRDEPRDVRNKDIWDNMHSMPEENAVYEMLFDATHDLHTDFDRNARITKFFNNYTEYDSDSFAALLQQIIGFQEQTLAAPSKKR